MQPDPVVLDWCAAVDRFAADMAGSFRPHAHFSRATGSLHVFIENVPTFRLRVDDRVSIMVSSLDHEAMAGLVVQDAYDLIGSADRGGHVRVKTVVERLLVASPSVFWQMDPKKLAAVQHCNIHLQ